MYLRVYTENIHFANFFNMVRWCNPSAFHDQHVNCAIQYARLPLSMRMRCLRVTRVTFGREPG